MFRVVFDVGSRDHPSLNISHPLAPLFPNPQGSDCLAAKSYASPQQLQSRQSPTPGTVSISIFVALQFAQAEEI